MKAWTVYDECGCDAEERGCLLVAAEDGVRAMELWGLALSRDLDGAVAHPAEWLWPINQVQPTVAGVWWPKERTIFGAAYRGYGFSEDGDPCCDECGDVVAPEDARSDPEDPDYTFCRWCQPRLFP